MVTRNSPVTVLPGVGKVKAAAYAKLGIFTLDDLLLHYPRAYENRGEIHELATARPDGKSALILTVGTEPKVVRLRSHKSFLKFKAFDDSGVCEVTYFNQDYLKSVFHIGSIFRFWGKVEQKGKRFLLSSPIAEPWAPGVTLPPLCAVYRLTDGISLKQITKDVEAALELLKNQEFSDPLPPELLEKHRFLPLRVAEEHLHRPLDREDLEEARRRLVYQEFFDFSLGMALMRRKTAAPTAPVCRVESLAPFLSLLPYRLTGAQERVIGEICADLAKPMPMSRMIVGDVGSGKTVCAAAAIWTVVKAGKQAALMAPTEILARQHYADLSVLFSRLRVRVALLLGATPAAEKRRIRAALVSKNPQERVDLVIGTHALLSEGVEFAAPGLVVADEQHRFGARQRAALAEKGQNTHLLVMSATPIPRSLALILYGDLSLSKIDELPPGRQRVDTFVVDEGYRNRLNDFIRRQLAEGGQVYVVCPAIEEAETAPDEVDFADLFDPQPSRPPLKAAVSYAAELEKIFPETKVGFLHGRLKSAQKEAMMNAFVAGEIGILVSTTVIEVGVNVPNASLMVVENAERFGLSQLHQLRGRVGRGLRKSYCVLVTGGQAAELGERSRDRLDVMRTTYDGFAIAEQDLKQRGPGDFLASSSADTVRQSGELSLRLGNLAEDSALLAAAAQDAAGLLAADPALQAHPLLAGRITAVTGNLIS